MAFRLRDNHTITLFEAEYAVWSGPIRQFMADNEIDAEQQADIHLELSVNGVYRGGGGASPIFELKDGLWPKPAPGRAKISGFG